MKKIVALDSQVNDYSFEASEFKKANAEFGIAYLKNENEFPDTVKNADVIIVNDVTLSRSFIAKMEKCKMIVCFGEAFYNVDIEAATEKGITVCSHFSCTATDTAEHAMALLLAFCKKIPLCGTLAGSSQWNSEKIGNVRRLKDKTIGFVGFDKTAVCLCEKTNAFDMTPLVFDPYVDFNVIEEMGAQKVSFDELLSRSDFVTLHLPLSYDTQHMMGMPEFKKMKNDAILINTSHGGLINESELVYALLTKEIGGAALDVFEEPLSPGNQLFKMDNVVLTPHISGNSGESFSELHKEVTENVIRFLNGEEPFNIVKIQ